MWNQQPPIEPGPYIASRNKQPRADMVRYWTGEHWTAPTAVRDLHLPGRMPAADWPAARDEHGRRCRVQWLRPYLLEASQ